MHSDVYMVENLFSWNFYIKFFKKVLAKIEKTSALGDYFFPQ